MKPLLLLLFAATCHATEYEYKATVDCVKDADTLSATIYLGLNISKEEDIRFLGIDAYEKATPKGKEAKAFVSSLLTGKQIKVLTSEKREKYGRLLGTVYIGTTNVSELLVQKGFAVPYNGGKRTL